MTPATCTLPTPCLSLPVPPHSQGQGRVKLVHTAAWCVAPYPLYSLQLRAGTHQACPHRRLVCGPSSLVFLAVKGRDAPSVPHSYLDTMICSPCVSPPHTAVPCSQEQGRPKRVAQGQAWGRQEGRLRCAQARGEAAEARHGLDDARRCGREECEGGRGGACGGGGTFMRKWRRGAGHDATLGMMDGMLPAGHATVLAP